MPWLGIDDLEITLAQATTLAASDVTVSSAIGANYGPVTVSGSGTSYTITLSQPINKADRVTVTIGEATIATFTRRLDVLPGDVNDDGVVNSEDLVDVRNMWLGITAPTIFGDINGDGVVNSTDYNDVRIEIGTSLPPVGGNAVIVGGVAVVLNAGSASTPPAVVQINSSTTNNAQRPATQAPRPRAEIQLALVGKRRSLEGNTREKLLNPSEVERYTRRDQRMHSLFLSNHREVRSL